MNTYPRIEIYTDRIRNNCKKVVKLCKGFDIDVMAVTKGFCAWPEIAKCFIEGGATALADARMKNIKKLQDFKVDKVLLRIPMLSELDDVVEYVDITLISEIETAKALGLKALQRDKVQRVIVMADMGDLREGFWPDDIIPAFGKLLDIKGIEVVGLGTNLSCYGGVIPSRKNMGMLVKHAKAVEDEYGIDLQMVSGGASSSMHLLFNGIMPKGINNLRIGESILLGRETILDIKREGYHSDTFVLKAEIVEVKEKPSVPLGDIGRDAFGKVPEFTDRGVRKRAIVAIGKQDIQPDTLIPYDEDIIILGGSSDHTILDVSDCDKAYKVGDILDFDLTYGGMLGGMTSPYVEKVFIE